MRQLIQILAILVLTKATAFSQEYKVTEFLETELPRVGGAEWFELNHSSNEFRVSIDQGEIKIDKAVDEKEVILETDVGRLIGSDHGEWGGKIEFIPKGTTDKKLIQEGNVKFIFRYNDGIYFIDGLAHLSTSTGAMYRLDRKADTYVPVKVVEFEDAPEAICILDDNIFIASHRTFFLVRALNKETIFENTFWSSLYPNSVAVIDNQNIYIGHRGGFTKLDIQNKEIRFFKFRTKIR